MSPSKIDLEILPFDSVDMYGEPDKDSAYSLSGRIAVQLVPSTGWFCDTAPPADEQFLLQSLVVTFQGQSELVAPQTGYASCRLIEFSQELITDGPLRLRHSWNQSTSRDPARWYVTFNLTIPGWLPPSCHTSYGNPGRVEPEVSYRLSAVAKYAEYNPTSQTSWRTACYGYMNLPTTQKAKARAVDVPVNRYTLPPPQFLLRNSDFTDAAFRSVEFLGSVSHGAPCIPTEILSKLRMRASVPEHIPLDAGTIPLLLKIRPDGMSLDERKRLHLPGFFVTATQNEVVRSSMSTTYAQKWPVPPLSEQPPTKALRSRRIDAREYECGLLFSAPAGTSATRIHSILPSGFVGRFDINNAPNTKVDFADSRFDKEDTWLRMRVDIPFRELFVSPSMLREYEDHPLPKLRPSELGPILSVHHELEISLTCVYDLPTSDPTGPDRVLDELKFAIPLSFVRVPRSGPHRPRVESFVADAGGPFSTTEPAGSVTMLAQVVELPRPSEPYALSLPGYNQLYYRDGARREDPTPLPRYSPKGQKAEEDPEDPPPAMAICKQTPLHKTHKSFAPSPLRS